MNSRQRQTFRTRTIPRTQPSSFVPQYDPLAHAMGMQRVLDLVRELEGLKSKWEEVIAQANENTKTAADELKKEYGKELELAHNSVMSIQRGQPGYTPKKGVDYFDGDDADPEEVASLVLERIPKQKEVDVEQLKRSIIATLPFMSQDGHKDAEFDIELFKKLIDEHLKNHPELKSIKNTVSGIDSRSRQYLHGGGDTVIAGTGISITAGSDGRKTVTNTGTATNYSENEVASGSGTSFTLAHTPTAGSVKVYGLGQRLILTTDYSISGGTITTVNSWNAGEIVADYRY